MHWSDYITVGCRGNYLFTVCSFIMDEENFSITPLITEQNLLELLELKSSNVLFLNCTNLFLSRNTSSYNFDPIEERNSIFAYEKSHWELQ